MVAAIPFAIWFFLAIEGVAMAAEEAKDPKRTIPKAYVALVIGKNYPILMTHYHKP